MYSLPKGLVFGATEFWNRMWAKNSSGVMAGYMVLTSHIFIYALELDYNLYWARHFTEEVFGRSNLFSLPHDLRELACSC